MIGRKEVEELKERMKDKELTVFTTEGINNFLDSYLGALEVIEFYSNKKNWDERWRDFGGDGDNDGDVSDVIEETDVDILEDENGPYMTHGGKRAREFMQKVNK